MDLPVRLIDLAIMHPRLLWEDICAAAVAVFENEQGAIPYHFSLDIQDIPGYGSNLFELIIDPENVSNAYVERLRRTYEPSRLVELAAIAISGFGLHYSGGHEIRDIALRGSGADYLVDYSNHLLEVAGRSRKRDFETAWQQKRQRLINRDESGFYISVAEFETPSGRLAFLE